MSTQGLSDTQTANLNGSSFSSLLPFFSLESFSHSSFVFGKETRAFVSVSAVKAGTPAQKSHDAIASPHKGSEIDMVAT